MHVFKGILACISIAITTVSVCAVLLVWSLHLAVARNTSKPVIKRRMDYIIIWWTQANRWMIRHLNLVSPEIHWEGREQLSSEQWYLVVCNHQTWADILLLQTYLLDDIPPLKFFTKSQLIWLPFLGQAMYVLGFPYVKRVSREQIMKNPSLRNADKDSVMKACEGLKNHPSTILNFAEGTRRTEEKHRLQDYAFQNLLKPKAGGINYTLEGMGSHLSGVVDVTIVYPDGAPTFWDFLQGKSGRVIFDARYRPLPALTAEKAGETHHKAQVAQWVHTLWKEKDALISRYLQSG